MEIPEGLLYSSEHEWVRVDGSRAVVGITDFAQDSLGDVVYVSIPALGQVVGAGEGCAEVESTKSVSDVYSPISGSVVAVNAAIADAPETVNSDPYGDGWLFAVEMSDPSEMAALLDAKAYRALTAED